MPAYSSDKAALAILLGHDLKQLNFSSQYLMREVVFSVRTANAFMTDPLCSQPKLV
jgi:hypothetical protein